VRSGTSYTYALEAVRTDGGAELFDVNTVTTLWWLKLPLTM
jgi:hypothetical protein